MQILRSLWLFIQDQVLGMKWLNVLIGDLLSLLGLDTASGVGSSILDRLRQVGALDNLSESHPGFIADN